MIHSSSVPAFAGTRHSSHSLHCARAAGSLGAYGFGHAPWPRQFGQLTGARNPALAAPASGCGAPGSGGKAPPLIVAGLRLVTTGARPVQPSLHRTAAPATLAYNHSFKPKPLRGSA